MCKNKGTKGFVEKSRSIHGDKFDYSLVNYINTVTHVDIICPVHGVFSQKPCMHYTSKGCAKCSAVDRGLKRRLTLEQFIKNSKEVHGEKYDYSKSKYEGVDKKVEIICNIHGSFWQRPHDHISDKNGCPECGKISKVQSRRKTQEQFLIDAVTLHGDKYDYSLAEYVNSNSILRIICKEHGVFEQKAVSHLVGHGCQKCGIKYKTYKDAKGKPKITNRLSQEEYIEKAVNKHGDKFDYSKVNYTKSDEKIIIICKKHNLEYTQTASTHLHGLKGGCPQCKKESTSNAFLKSNEDFIQEAVEIHDGFYDYSKSEYKNSKTKLKISCPLHGEFEQTPNDHLNGHGCRKCGSVGSTYNITKAERNKEEWSKIQTTLYLIEFKSNDENYIKVGISNEKSLRHSVLERVSKCKIVDSLLIDIDLYNAVIIEQTTLKDIKYCKYIPLHNYPGYTECFNIECKDEVKNNIQKLLEKKLHKHLHN